MRHNDVESFDFFLKMIIISRILAYVASLLCLFKTITSMTNSLFV